MEYLDPPRLRDWYERSLAFSGYESLRSEMIDLWTRVVERGFVSAPPGLVAALAERVTHQPAGPGDSGERAPLETELLDLVARGASFSRLEGEFLLEGRAPDEARVARVVERLVTKLGQLYHPEVFFAAEDIPVAMELGPETTTSDPGPFPPERDYDPGPALESIYRDAIRYWIDRDGALDENDLFEIQHPDLFTSPTARSLFRKMQDGARGIRHWLGSDRTLREEGDEVVRRFGEPQVLPLGGFDSFTRQGNLTSLVPSELALIDRAEAIDLFDYKYLERELLYYKREEGLIFRIRRSVALSLRLTPGTEHERNLALLLAFSLTFLERVFALFTKDLLVVHVFLHGYVPTELRSGLEFFRHFLGEAGFDDGLEVHIGERYHPDPGEHNYQHWVIGDAAPEDDAAPSGSGVTMKEVPFSFPDLNHLAEIPLEDRWRFLGDEIEDIIDGMVEIAHR